MKRFLIRLKVFQPRFATGRRVKRKTGLVIENE